MMARGAAAWTATAPTMATTSPVPAWGSSRTSSGIEPFGSVVGGGTGAHLQVTDAVAG